LIETVKWFTWCNVSLPT